MPVPRRLSPEERYLQKKRAELATLEAQLAERELEVHTLRGGLISFAPHTVTHPNLADLAPAELDRELRESKELIEQRLAHAVTHVSAPYGDAARFTPAVSEAARAAGYASCATAIRGPNETNDVYALHRDHVVASWPVRDLRYFLSR